jgi:hypothetical protein
MCTARSPSEGDETWRVIATVKMKAVSLTRPAIVTAEEEKCILTISTPPKALTNHTALPISTFLAASISSPFSPLYPCGTLLLSFDSGTAGFARSENHDSRLLSVKVIRDGRRNVGGLNHDTSVRRSFPVGGALWVRERLTRK